ncbi:hypothetical protein GLOIN_2v1805050 [Rhizophagus clarus]|uniref:Myb-like domain-containing protein n=1 Tax=Rhizophagus clarus TaxID=94130 RepID=A0A8H3LNQ7_9GLOM|nr:hypothetical protein GLOIN_2v1805050 [Rhizophagus clarus]
MNNAAAVLLTVLVIQTNTNHISVIYHSSANARSCIWNWIRPQFSRHQWTYIEEILLILLVILLGRNWSSWRRISRLINRSVSQCRRRYYEIIDQDSSVGNARRIRWRVNQRISQGLRPIALERLLHEILLVQQQNIIVTRDPRMDLSHILNTSRDLNSDDEDVVTIKAYKSVRVWFAICSFPKYIRNHFNIQLTI